MIVRMKKVIVLTVVTAKAKMIVKVIKNRMKVVNISQMILKIILNRKFRKYTATRNRSIFLMVAMNNQRIG